MAKNVKASENKAKDKETNLKRQEILAKLGEIALEQDYLRTKLQQSIQVAIELKAQLAKL